MIGLALATLAGIANLLGAYLTMLRHPLPRRMLLYLIAIGAGFMLSWTLLELVPTLALESPAMLGLIIVGYFGIYILENVFTYAAHHHPAEELHGHALIDTVRPGEPLISSVASWTAFSGLFLHAFFDGAGIAASFRIHPATGVLMFLAVILHKIPEGSSLSSIMLAAQQGQRTAVTTVACIAGSTVLGAAVVTCVGSFHAAVAYVVLALSAGTFLFVGASNLIPATQRGEYRSTALVALVGVALFYLSHAMIRRWLPSM